MVTVITLKDIIALVAIGLFLVIILIVFISIKYNNYKNDNNKISGYLLLINKTNSSDNFKAKHFKNKSEIKTFFKSKDICYGIQYNRHLIIKFKGNYYQYLVTDKDYDYIEFIINDSKFK